MVCSRQDGVRRLWDLPAERPDPPSPPAWTVPGIASSPAESKREPDASLRDGSATRFPSGSESKLRLVDHLVTAASGQLAVEAEGGLTVGRVEGPDDVDRFLDEADRAV